MAGGRFVGKGVEFVARNAGKGEKLTASALRAAKGLWSRAKDAAGKVAREIHTRKVAADYAKRFGPAPDLGSFRVPSGVRVPSGSGQTTAVQSTAREVAKRGSVSRGGSQRLIESRAVVPSNGSSVGPARRFRQGKAMREAKGTSKNPLDDTLIENSGKTNNVPKGPSKGRVAQLPPPEPAVSPSVPPGGKKPGRWGTIAKVVGAGTAVGLATGIAMSDDDSRSPTGVGGSTNWDDVDESIPPRENPKKGGQTTAARSTPRSDAGEKPSKTDGFHPGPPGFSGNGSDVSSYNYYAHGRQIDPTNTVERNMRMNQLMRESSAATRQYTEDREVEDAARRARRSERIDRVFRDAQKKIDDRNYENRKFSGKRGWDNLANVEGRASDRDIQGYGKDHEEYQRGWASVSDKIAKLGQFFKENGNLGGHQKEFNEISKLMNDTHNGVGLSQAQMEAGNGRLDAILESINGARKFGYDKTEYYKKRNIEDKRRQLGDTLGAYSDKQVLQLANDKKWGDIRSAMGSYEATMKENGSPETAGGWVTGSGNGRFDAMNKMAEHGISLPQMAKLAVRQGGEWQKRYGEIMAGDEGTRTQAIENLGYDFMKNQLSKPGGERVLQGMVDKLNTVTGSRSGSGFSALTWDNMGGSTTDSGDQTQQGPIASETPSRLTGVELPPAPVDNVNVNRPPESVSSPLPAKGVVPSPSAGLPDVTTLKPVPNDKIVDTTKRGVM